MDILVGVLKKFYSNTTLVKVKFCGAIWNILFIDVFKYNTC